MAAQMLIYEKAVPVDKVRHKNRFVETEVGFGFTRKINAVPVVAVEFSNAAAEYAIVFAGGEKVMPVVVLGVRSDENLYLTGDGSWLARYVPAFVRRYPFVFSEAGDGRSFMLCIDEDYEGCNEEGRGERLFDEGDRNSKYLDGVLSFLKAYREQYQRTESFCRKLKELDLLMPMKAQFKMKTGQQLGLTGFMAVDREKLKKLPGDKLSELVKTGELELLYLHLHSLRNFSGMAEKRSVASVGDQKVEEPAAKTKKKKKEQSLTIN